MRQPDRAWWMEWRGGSIQRPHSPHGRDESPCLTGVRRPGRRDDLAVVLGSVRLDSRAPHVDGSSGSCPSAAHMACAARLIRSSSFMATPWLGRRPASRGGGWSHQIAKAEPLRAGHQLVGVRATVPLPQADCEILIRFDTGPPSGLDGWSVRVIPGRLIRGHEGRTGRRNEKSPQVGAWRLLEPIEVFGDPFTAPDRP